jgi:hypothetical protein
MGWCSTSGMLASVLGTSKFGEVHNLTNCNCLACNFQVHNCKHLTSNQYQMCHPCAAQCWNHSFEKATQFASSWWIMFSKAQSDHCIWDWEFGNTLITKCKASKLWNIFKFLNTDQVIDLRKTIVKLALSTLEQFLRHCSSIPDRLHDFATVWPDFHTNGTSVRSHRPNKEHPMW